MATSGTIVSRHTPAECLLGTRQRPDPHLRAACGFKAPQRHSPQSSTPGLLAPCCPASRQASHRLRSNTAPTAQVSSGVALVASAPLAEPSPYGHGHGLVVTWGEVLHQTVARLANINPEFKLRVVDSEDAQETANIQADVFLGVKLHGASARAMPGASVPNRLYFDCDPELQSQTALGDSLIKDRSAWKQVTQLLPWTQSAKESKTLMATIQRFWERNTTDDLLFLLLVVIDAHIQEVPWVQSMRATGLGSIACMAQNCGKQVLACVQDPECKAALDCLNDAAPNDQVASYRCIVSHETPALNAFTLCVLQRHNCLGLHAPIPQRPSPEPMPSFRGQPLTHETAEDIFIGWLGEKRWSWRVVAGQNAAYDQFPNQYQLYYRGKGKNVLWYDPVFQVHTLDGRTVWRKRHYRVRRAQQPGTFHFSVLDNGVISSEFWRIVDCPDDLSWALFFYAGAASVAGQAYTGAVLTTPDGEWPEASQQERIKAALARADMKVWELFKVGNNNLPDAPLDISEKDGDMGKTLHQGLGPLVSVAV